MIVSLIGRGLSPNLWWLLWSEFLCENCVRESVEEVGIAASEFLLRDPLHGLLCGELEFPGEVPYRRVELLVSDL